MSRVEIDSCARRDSPAAAPRPRNQTYRSKVNSKVKLKKKIKNKKIKKKEKASPQKSYKRRSFSIRSPDAWRYQAVHLIGVFASPGQIQALPATAETTGTTSLEKSLK